MLLVHWTLAQDILLDKLDDGPGLLPFKLGESRVISHYHSFLQYVDLKEMQSKLDSVQMLLNNSKPKLNNKTLSLFEPHISYLESKLHKISEQLITFEPQRVKRGLIDGLGSVIKSISGNLDYTDAIRYDNAFKTLEGNQNQLQSEINNQVSLTKDWISRHSKILDDIVYNQNKIDNILNKLMAEENTREADLIRYAHLAQFLLILGDNIDNLSEELLTLETTLAFIKSSTFSHSMLSSSSLKEMLRKIGLIYSDSQIINVELRNYYDLIKLGSYYVDSKIVLVYKVPIALPDIYLFYKLSIIPNKHNLALIPILPYVAIRKNDSMYMRTECPRINNWYVCEKGVNYNVQGQPDCVERLITTQQRSQPCNLTPVILTREAVERLDDEHYTLSFPKPTKTQLICGQEQYRILEGSYLATLPQRCTIKTPEITVTNVHDVIKGHVIKIMNLLPDLDQVAQPEQPAMTLKSIHLENLHDSTAKILSQQPVTLSRATETSLYHTTIPIYTLLFGACALAVGLACRRIFRKRRSELQPEIKITQPTYAEVPEKPKRSFKPDQMNLNYISAAFSPSTSNSC